MLKRAAEFPLTRCKAAQQETVAHRADHAVVPVDHAGAPEDEPDFAGPRECSPAFGAEQARPCTIVDFAQPREHFGLCVRAHG